MHAKLVEEVLDSPRNHKFVLFPFRLKLHSTKVFATVLACTTVNCCELSSPGWHADAWYRLHDFSDCGNLESLSVLCLSVPERGG